MGELASFHLSAPIAFNCSESWNHGDWRWRRQPTYPSSERSADSNCAKLFRLQTALSTKWSSAENFRDALLFPPAASFGTSRKSKPGWPRADQPPSRARNLPMSGSGDRARFDRRVRFKQRHRRRDEYRDALLARDPGVDDVRPLLHHMAALHFVFCLVVNAARGTAVLMRKALLDPVAVEAEFVEQRRARPPQVVNGERLQAAGLPSSPARQPHRSPD